MQKIIAFIHSKRKYALSLFVTFALFFELGSYLWSKPNAPSVPNVRILCAKRDIKTGEFFSMNDFYLKEMPPTSAPSLSVSDQKLSWLSGAKFEEDLEKDGLLNFKNILLSPSHGGYSKWTPKGFRAISLTTQNILKIRPGDHLDLYEENNHTHKLILENVLVLEGNADRPQYAVVLVSPKDIEKLANPNSKWVISIRNPNDTQAVAKRDGLKIWQD